MILTPDKVSYYSYYTYYSYYRYYRYYSYYRYYGYYSYYRYYRYYRYYCVRLLGHSHYSTNSGGRWPGTFWAVLHQVLPVTRVFRAS